MKCIGPFVIDNLVLASPESTETRPPQGAEIAESEDFASFLLKYAGKAQDSEDQKETETVPKPIKPEEKVEERDERLLAFSHLPFIELPGNILPGETAEELALEEAKGISQQILLSPANDLPQLLSKEQVQLELETVEVGLNHQQNPENARISSFVSDEKLVARDASDPLIEEDTQLAQTMQKQLDMQIPEQRNNLDEDLSWEFNPELADDAKIVSDQRTERPKPSLEIVAKKVRQQVLAEQTPPSLVEEQVSLGELESLADEVAHVSKAHEMTVSVDRVEFLHQALQTSTNDPLREAKPQSHADEQAVSVVHQREIEVKLVGSGVPSKKDVVAEQEKLHTNLKVNSPWQQEHAPAQFKLPETKERISIDKHTELATIDLPRQDAPLEIVDVEVPVREVLELADRESLFPRLVQSVESLVTEERSEVRIQLKPDHLGELKIKLSLERGIMVAEFIVENEAVREVIASQLPQLHTALQDHGGPATDVQINIGLGQDNQDHQDQSRSKKFAQSTAGRIAKQARPGVSKSYLGEGIWNQVDVRV